MIITTRFLMWKSP